LHTIHNIPGYAAAPTIKKIDSLEGKLSALKASRNWFRDRYIWASSYFEKNKLPFMYPWKASDAPPRVSHIPPAHDSTINAIREIQNCFVANFNIDTKYQRYTSVSKLFPSLCTQCRVSHTISCVILSHFPAPSSFEKSSATKSSITPQSFTISTQSHT
jgi:hypothetical protein